MQQHLLCGVLPLERKEHKSPKGQASSSCSCKRQSALHFTSSPAMASNGAVKLCINL